MTFDAKLVTLNRLAQFATESRDDEEEGLAELGLIIHRHLDRLSYESTPSNVWTFASTGGDGVHFSLLDLGEGPTESSPVVMTVPMAFGDREPNWVLGESLRDFLALGRGIGYFSLDQLAYGRGWTVVAAGFRGRGGYPVLDDLATTLGLEEWADVESHLVNLKARYHARLQFSRSA